MSSKSSLKVITHRPSLLLLPTVTFFTFSKVQVGCSRSESRVKFSKKFTWINMAVSAVGFSCLLVWCSLQYLNHVNIFQLEHFIFVFIPLVSFLPSLILTILFLHLDRLCSCCSCTGVPGEEISVYDPNMVKRFVIKDGELVEPPEEDVETAPSSLCGCLNLVEEDTLRIVF